MIIYVDPGNGLFILQAAASIVLGGVFMARSKVAAVYARVRHALRGGRKDEPDISDNPSDS